MVSLRVEHKKNYTCISNAAIKDGELSLKARGLHHLILSYPDNWRLSTDSLLNGSECKKDGRTAVLSALKELEELGYIQRSKIRNDKGQYSYEYVVSECRKSSKPVSGKPDSGKPVSGKPVSGKPDSGKPGSGKPDCILSTDLTSTDLLSTERELIKENDFFQKSPLSVENDFSETPSDSELKALMQAELNPTNSEAAEVELAKLRPHLSSTLATLEKTSVPPPRENGSQIIKTAADVKPAIAAKKRRAAASVDRAAQHNPDAAEAWWVMFRTQAHKADCKPGVKSEAIAAWDLLHKIEPEETKATLYERIIQGTEAYWEREAARQNPSCKHGVRFLEKRDWEEALQWAEVKSSSSGHSAQRFAPFLTCWNQDRPMTWPTADEGDLSPKSTGRLEELIASCANSLERFQKALHWAKRDPYWGLQRSQTLEEFLYSGRINEFYKKQIHAESIGMDKVVAPDRKAVEAASKMAASKRESVARYLEEYRRGELTLSEAQTILTSIGVDPASVLEVC